MHAQLSSSVRISPTPRGLWLRLSLALLCWLTGALRAQSAPPSVTIQSPVDQSHFYAEQFSISGIASDPNNLALSPVFVSIKDVQTDLYWDGTGWVASAPVLPFAPVSGGSWHYTGPLPPVADGDFAAFLITALVANSENTFSPLVAHQNANTVLVIGGGPVVQVAAPEHNSVIQALTNIAGVAVDYAEVGFSPAVVSLTLFDVDRGEYWNGSSWTTTPSVLTAAIASDHSWSRTAGLPTGANARSGQFALSASVANAAGVSSKPKPGGNNLLFRIDQSPPEVAFSGITAGATVASLGGTLAGTVSDNLGVRKVTLFLKRQADGLWWTGYSWAAETETTTPSLTTQLGTGTFQRIGQLPLPGLSSATRLTDGDYTLYAIAEDTAGNFGNAIVPFHVLRETTPPTVTLETVQPGSTIPALTAVSGLVSDNVGVEKVFLYLYRVADDKWWNGVFWTSSAPNGVPVLPAVVNGNGTGYSYISALPQAGSNPDYRLINGDYTLYAIAQDTSENFAQVIVPFHVEFVYHWTGETDSLWSSAGNWSPSDIPADNDIVQIDGGAYVNSATSRSVRQLRMSGETTTLGGFSLLIGGPGSGSKWSGGEIRGSLAVAPGASLEIDTTGVPRLANASLVNAGTITVTGDLTANPNARLSASGASIENAGAFVLARDGLIFENTYLQPTFSNYGILVKSAGAGVTDFGSFRFVNDNGYVQANGGILRFTDRVSLLHSGGITGVGAVRFAANNASIAGLVYVYGNLEFASGSASFNDATLNISALGRVRVLGGALGGTVTLGSGRMEIDTTATPLFEHLTLTNHGVIAISGDPANGGLEGSDTNLINELDGRVELARIGNIFVNHYIRPKLTNRGTIALTATSGLTSFGDWELSGDTNGVVSLATGGSLRLQSYVGFGAGSQVTGTGLLRLETNHLVVHGRLSTEAAVELRSGTLNGADGAEIATSGYGSFTWTGGSLTGPIGVPTGSVWTVDTTSTPTLAGASLNNHGRIVIIGSPSVGTLEGSGSSIFNFADGRIEIARDGDIFYNPYIQPQLGNVGTIVKTAGTGTANFGSFLLSNGTGGIVAADSGTLRFTDYVSLGQDTQLSGSGPIRFESNQLHLTGRVLVSGRVEFAAGTLRADDSSAQIATSGNGQFLWTGGVMTGTLAIPTGSRLDIDTTNSPCLGSCTLSNSGLIAIGGSGSGTLYGSRATLNNLTGGRIEFSRDGAIFHNDYILPTLNNSGTIAKVAGTETTDFGDFALVQAAGGVLRTDTGTLRLNDDVRFEQDSVVAGTGIIRLESTKLSLVGRLLVQADTRFSGGRIACSDDGNAQIATGPGGQFHWSAGRFTGSLTIPVGSRMDVDTTLGPDLGGTINNAGRLVITGSPTSGTLTASGSTINNLATGSLEFARDGVIFENTYITPYVNNAGLIAKTAGTLSDFGSFILLNSGRISVPAGTALQLTNSMSFQNGSVIGGGGVVQLVTGNATLAGPTSIEAGSTLELGVAPGARLIGATSGNGQPTGSIAGPGTFRWSRGTFSGFLAFASTSNVVIDTTNGIYINGALTLAGNASLVGTQPLPGSSAAIEILPTGVLQIPGPMSIVNDYIEPVFQNDGLVRLGAGATLTSSWSCRQTSTGTMEFQIAGSGAGQFSKIQLSRPVTLAGQIKVTRLNGYSPPKDTAFPIATYPARNGAFTSTAGLGLGNGLMLTPVVTDSSVTLNTILSPFGTWQAAKFGANADNPALAGPLATPAGDGIPNALKYAFNLDPFTDGSAKLPRAGLVVDPSTGLKHLGITFRRLIGAQDPIYVPRVSAGLTGAWDASGTQVEQFGSASPNGDGTETVTFRLTTPLQPGTQRFMDLEVDFL